METFLISFSTGGRVVSPVEEEGQPPFVSNRFYIKIKYSVNYKFDEDNIIEETRPIQWFDFPKDSLFTYQDASSMLRDMNCLNFTKLGVRGISSTQNKANGEQYPVMNGRRYLFKLVKSVNSDIDKYKHNNNFIVDSSITKIKRISNLDEFKDLASKRARRIQKTLDDMARVHHVLNCDGDHVSTAEWISKIRDYLTDYGIYLNRVDSVISANTVMRMIRDKSCKICLEDIEFRSPFKIMHPCKHIFHSHCLNGLAHNECLICRPRATVYVDLLR